MTDLKSNKKRKGHPQVINPVGEFCLPVQLPDDPEWVAAFIGAVRKLSNRSTWDYDAGGDYIVVADRWAEVADEIQARYAAHIDCDAEICEDGSCTEIRAHHPALTYFPNNPITQPDYEGPYQTPVWGTGAGYIGATGSDSMIDVFAYATQNLIDLLTGAALPSVTLNFNGDGEIDVQFLATIQGGAVWGFPDGNPLMGDLVSLQHTDVFSLAGVQTLIDFFEVIIQQDTEAFVVTHSWTFDTPGDHTLTLIFFPTADLEPPFLGAGGGLRSVQLCGNATVSEETVTAYTISLDGDSLNLLADGVPVSEIPKTTLQSFLDRWIDNAPMSQNEVFTGNLDSYPNASDKYRTIIKSGIGTLLEEAYISGHSSVRWIAPLPNRGFIFAADSPRVWVSVKSGRFMVVDDGVSGGVDGYLATLRSTGSKIPLLVQKHGSAAMMAEFQDATKALAGLTNLGQWLGVSFEAYGRSSTDAWRRQFALAGFWDQSTESIRRGGAIFALNDWNGDREVWRADYDPIYAVQQRLAFFGGTGSFPGDYNIRNDGTPWDRLVDQLRIYGLVDPDDFTVNQPEAATGLTEAEACNAAYFIAGQIAALVESVYDNLAVVTSEEVLTGLIDDWKIQASFAQQIQLALQVYFINQTDVLSDLSDADTIAAQLVVAEFQQDEFLSWVASYGGFATSATVSVLQAVIAASWASVVANWIELGRHLDNPNCARQFKLPCASATYDFRWGTLHGWELEEGTPVIASGIENELNDGDYSVRLHGYFDACTIAQVHVTYYGQPGGSPQNIEVWRYTSDGMGGYDLDPIPYQTNMLAGENVWTIGIPGGGLLFDRMRVRMNEQPNYYDNSVRKVEIEVS